MKKENKYYLVSLLIIILLSIYPIYMGGITMTSYIRNQYVAVGNYPKYIILYTPLCIALIIIIAIMPLTIKLFKKYALLWASLLGIALFFGAEHGLKSIGEPIYAENNSAYKMHFYIIAIVILLAVLNTVFGFYNMILDNNKERKRPLIAQFVAVIAFVALCIHACITAFWRNGTLNISMLSSMCMIIFFIVFGLTFGTYIGTILYGKENIISCFIPAVLASITTIVMYIGELMMTGGKLFIYGHGWFFEPIGEIPFAMVDVMVILLSGVLTYFIMLLINQNEEI